MPKMIHARQRAAARVVRRASCRHAYGARTQRSRWSCKPFAARAASASRAPPAFSSAKTTNDMFQEKPLPGAARHAGAAQRQQRANQACGEEPSSSGATPLSAAESSGRAAAVVRPPSVVAGAPQRQSGREPTPIVLLVVGRGQGLAACLRPCLGFARQLMSQGIQPMYASSASV